MSKYEMVMKYYASGIWDEQRVRAAVVKGWITAEQFTEITGKAY